MAWPSWLDEVESLVDRTLTCPDCWYVEGGVTKFPVFKSEKCKHKGENR